MGISGTGKGATRVSSPKEAGVGVSGWLGDSKWEKSVGAAEAGSLPGIEVDPGLEGVSIV